MKLEQAQALITTALAKAQGDKMNPLALVVVDAGGHCVAGVRQDGAPHFIMEIATAKAKGAAGLGMDTRRLAELAQGEPHFFQSLSSIVGGDIAYSPGGIVVCDDAGALIGALAISGDTGERDEALAFYAVKACGLRSSHDG